MPTKPPTVVIAVSSEESQRPDVIDALRCVQSVKAALRKKGYTAHILPIAKRDLKASHFLVRQIRNFHPICVFNLFEGFSDAPEKEIEFVQILESAQIPLTGNGSQAVRICLNKFETKRLLQKANIPIPRGIGITQTYEIAQVSLDYPLFVKPALEDASLGIDEDSLLPDPSYLSRTIERKLREFPSGLIVEEFIPGAEYNVGLLAEYPYEIVGVSVIDYYHYNDFLPFLSYRAKWEHRTDEYKAIIPGINPVLPSKLRKQIEDLARRAGECLMCQGYFRVDIREKDSRLFVLDVNPNPDINVDSGFMRQAYALGYKYEDIIERIVKFAVGQKTHV